MCAKCIQPMSTFTREKTRCQRLNQTETEMQRSGESRMCDAKWIDRWPNNQP
jgi:hypothetical protein